MALAWQELPALVEERLRLGRGVARSWPEGGHCKVMVVDALWVSVGSTNFDNRSFRLNDEANLNIYDAEFARRQTDIFEDDLRHSRRISLQQWQQRPLAEKLWEHAAALLRDQL